MPISPQEAAEHRRENNREVIKLICAKIDKILKERQPPIWVNTNGMNQDVVSEIVHIYKSLGWKVEYVSDQRDGDSLVFNAPVMQG